MKAIIYARESADKTKAPPITEQIDRAKDYIKEQGYQLIEIYKDEGYSGGDWKRPAWRQLVNDAKMKRFNIVVVWNQDRIARDTEQFLWFHRNLKDAHVKLYSICDGWINLDTVGDTAKNISIAMASQLFRQVTSEKVKRAYSSKKNKADEKGEDIKWGRDKLEFDLDKAKQLKAQNPKWGYRKIAKFFPGVGFQTIRRRLIEDKTVTK